MNARSYRVNLILTPVDFPPIMGLGQSSIFFQTEPPHIINNKVVLMITKKYILVDMNTNKEHEVLTAQSIYEIPPNEIKSREDVYEFYKDATLSLNEAYQYAKTQMPALPNILLPTPQIQTYKQEIDGVFYILSSQN
jgi:hypothetical protein